MLALQPRYHARVLVVEGLQPGPTDDRSDTLLMVAERKAVARLGDRRPEELDHVAEWREAYRSFGAKPQRTRNSVEALLRRVAAGLPRVDRVTDTYNAISVSHVLPVGGEDADAYAGSPQLVRARGDEPFAFTAHGEPAVEHPETGEVVWRDELGVTCRRWNWRQGQRTLITTGTTRGLFILDALASLSPAELDAAAVELVANLAAFSPGLRVRQRELGTSG